MALKDTVKRLRELLSEVCANLDKAEKGNSAAAQRARTATIRLEKVAKVFRKESVKEGKKSKGKKKPAAKKTAAKKKAPASKKAAPKKKAPAKKKPAKRTTKRKKR